MLGGREGVPGTRSRPPPTAGEPSRAGGAEGGRRGGVGAAGAAASPLPRASARTPCRGANTSGRTARAALGPKGAVPRHPRLRFLGEPLRRAPHARSASFTATLCSAPLSGASSTLPRASTGLRGATQGGGHRSESGEGRAEALRVCFREMARRLRLAVGVCKVRGSVSSSCSGGPREPRAAGGPEPVQRPGDATGSSAWPAGVALGVGGFLHSRSEGSPHTPPPAGALSGRTPVFRPNCRVYSTSRNTWEVGAAPRRPRERARRPCAAWSYLSGELMCPKVLVIAK